MTLPTIASGTSITPRGAVNQALDRSGRAQRWAAALLTLVLHVLFALFLMSPPTPIIMSTPQGQAGGSTMEVTLIDDSPSLPPPEPEPSHRKPVHHKKPKAPRAIVPMAATPVVQADIPMPPKVADASDTTTVPPSTEPEPTDAQRDPADPPEQPFGPTAGVRPMTMHAQTRHWPPGSAAIVGAATTPPPLEPTWA